MASRVLLHSLISKLLVASTNNKVTIEEAAALYLERFRLALLGRSHHVPLALPAKIENGELISRLLCVSSREVEGKTLFGLPLLLLPSSSNVNESNNYPSFQVAIQQQQLPIREGWISR